MDGAKAGEIIAADLELIKGSDAILAVIEKPSIGTSMEIFFCSYVLKKPVYAVTEKYRNHIWLKNFSTAVYGTLEEFLSSLR